jgi:lipoprotein NlpI
MMRSCVQHLLNKAFIQLQSLWRALSDFWKATVHPHRSKIYLMVSAPNGVHLSTAIKLYPGCRMTHSGIDLASKWRKDNSCPVKSLRLYLSPHWFVSSLLDDCRPTTTE